MAAVLLVVAPLIAAYWIAWLTHRSLVASGTSLPYTRFEDGWLVLCLVAASFCLLTKRRAALFWLLAGFCLFAMDALYDLRHGIWGKGGNGINLVTLGLSLFVLRWAWVRRRTLIA